MEVPTTGTFDKQLILDDGQPELAYRIKSFKIFPQVYEGQAFQWPDAWGYLATELGGPSRILASDPRQLAWACYDNTSGSGMQADDPFELVDPVVFVRELWIKMWVMPNTAGAADYNYYIEIERVPLSEIEALVQLATEVRP